MTCACGCGQQVPDPPRGGLIWYRDYKLFWYATNECMAREESEFLRNRAKVRSES